MAENGFIRDMLDVKVLILYVASLTNRPLDVQTVYELCYVDNRLTYFDVCEAVPELVQTGHLSANEDETYAITAKGREALNITVDSLAFTVRQDAGKNVDRYLADLEKQMRVRVQLLENPDGWHVRADYKKDNGETFSLEIPASDKKEAREFGKILSRHAERLFGAVMEDIREELPE